MTCSPSLPPNPVDVARDCTSDLDCPTGMLCGTGVKVPPALLDAVLW